MSSKKHPHILVVDDDPGLLELLCDTLSAIGYQVTDASGGAAALELLEKQPFDLIITDVKMPDIDGLQLLKKVKQHYPQLPVLFITGAVSADTIGAVDVDGFLAKPFRISRIEELIAHTLGDKSIRSPHRTRHILIIDRDPKLCEHLSEALSHADYLPFAVNLGTDALTELANGHFDVIITESNLVDMNSQALLDEIHAQYSEIPVILTTDSACEKKTEISTKWPVAGCLKKPFKASQMLLLLDQITVSED